MSRGRESKGKRRKTRNKRKEEEVGESNGGVRHGDAIGRSRNHSIPLGLLFVL